MTARKTSIRAAGIVNLFLFNFDYLLFEMCHRIHILAVLDDFKVEMRTCGIACRADKTELLTLFDHIALLYRTGAHVGIEGGVAIGMLLPVKERINLQRKRDKERRNSRKTLWNGTQSCYAFFLDEG